nr:MAG: putative capsid protein [Inari totivirus 2]
MEFHDQLLWKRPLGKSACWDAAGILPWMVKVKEGSIVQSTKIEEVDAHVKTRYSLENSAGILSHGVRDINMVVRTSRGICSVSKKVMEEIGCRVDLNMEVTDMSGFFACGYFLAAHLDYFEKAAIAPGFVGMQADCIIVSNVAAYATDEEVNHAVGAIIKAMNEQTIGFQRRYLSETDVQVLISIAMGGSSSVRPGMGQPSMPVTCFVEWPKRKYFLWDTKPVVLPEEREVLTAAQVRSSMSAFAKLLDAYDDMATGFVKAASILVMRCEEWTLGVSENAKARAEKAKKAASSSQIAAGPSSSTASYKDAASRDKIIEALSRLIAMSEHDLAKVIDAQEEGEDEVELYSRAGLIEAVLAQIRELKNQKQQVEKATKKPEAPVVDKEPVKARGMIHAMLECGTIQVQRVRGHNFMWDMMHIPRPSDAVDPLLHEDGMHLSGMRSYDVMRTMQTIGGLLSVAAGSVLHGMSITGRELNLWAAGTGCPSTDILRTVFQATHSGTVAPYYQLVIGAFQQMMHFNINPAFVRNCGLFSALGAGLAEVNHSYSWWQSVWPNHIPYLIDPASMSWAYRGWNDSWGIYGPSPDVNFTHDVVRGGCVDNEYLSFHRDEPAYVAAASSRQPFINIPYGLFALNVCRQICDPDRGWAVTIRLARIAASGAVDLERPRYDIWQPQWNETTKMAVIGCLPVFDWARNSIIVPGLDRRTVGDNHFYTITRVAERAYGVGLQRDGYISTKSSTNYIVGPDILSLMSGLDASPSNLKPYASTSRSGN